MIVTFINTTINVVADNPKQAYERLCNMFQREIRAGNLSEYETDEYTVLADDHTESDPRSTEELWPE